MQLIQIKLSHTLVGKQVGFQGICAAETLVAKLTTEGLLSSVKNVMSF
jgi:hypothetical protein